MERKLDKRQVRAERRQQLLCASDRYFFGCMGAYAIAAAGAAFTGAVPMEAVSFLWLSVLLAPFVVRPLGRSLGLRK